MRKVFGIIVIIVILILILPVMVSAATYYISTSGNDNNAGSQALPFRTIQRCANVAQAGDTCYVRTGTYNERVSLSRSGTASAFINFVGHPLDTMPVMRGFDVSANYIRIIGFEITHTDTSYSRAIVFGGTRSNIEILNNYIHNTYNEGGAIRAWGTITSNITVRGNEFYYVGCVPGVWCNGNGWAVQTYYVADHWLIEYNHVHRVGDFVNVYGNHQIIRNNYMHDYQDAYFASGGGGGHTDFFQPGSDGTNTYVNHHIYESNFLGDNIEVNSHILQMRDTVNAGDREIIFRGNVGYNVGSYAMQAGGIDNVYYYSNTIHDINNMGGGNWAPATYYNAEGGDYSLNNFNFNNIFSETAGPTGIAAPISVCSGCSLNSSNNLCFGTGSHSSCASNSNPLFVSTASHDFHLQSGSPAIGLGKAITTVISSSGSGTSFNVADASFFSDGYGVAEGDIIKVGSNEPVRITSISGNTITVDRSITWSNGNGVYWRNQDASPDAGAYEYRSGGYNYGISINSPANNSAVSGSVNILTTPTNPELIRQVIFYIDGVPASRDFSSPFSFAWNAAGQTQGSSHVIEAVAYPLYATTDLWKSSRIVVSVGAEIQPSVCTEADWSHSDGACQSTNILTRTWTKTSANCQGGVSHSATENVVCTYGVQPVVGDVNGDNKVDISDLSIVAINFGKTSGFDSRANVVSSTPEVIDILDLSFVARRFTG